MVPTDRFLEGLFAPHGGLSLPAPKRVGLLTRFGQWLERVCREIRAALTRVFRRDDYALCH